MIVPRVVLLCCVLADVHSFGCDFPCVKEDCEIVRPESCRYGVVNDTCLCCTVCGEEPGRDCGDTIGFCGKGLECFKNFPDGLTAEERRGFPGICRVPISKFEGIVLRIKA